MEKEKLEGFKKRLLEEKGEVEKELSHIARKNAVTGDWEPVPEEPDTVVADKNDIADRLEDFEERQSTEYALETRLNTIEKALSKIEDGTYGVCEVSGEPIPIERLEANPAATTKAEYAE
jgi:RNA polymerase-binding protein DksA